MTGVRRCQLGWEAECDHCREWWPLDDSVDFWRGRQPTVCRACEVELRMRERRGEPAQHRQGTPYATDEERREARRRSWRESKRRTRGCRVVAAA